MQTVFSHIVSNRLSQEYENIATESLVFILQNSKSARRGIMKLIHSVAPNMPDLQFRTQQIEQLDKRIFRPDMLGYHERETRVFIENKFEAGLTNNQPNSYLEQLARGLQPSVLLVIVPEARVETMWGELNRRLQVANISTTAMNKTSGSIAYSVETEQGPILTLLSWPRLLTVLENEVTDDPDAKNDLLQLRALCEAADRDAFIPFSPEVISDQRTPAFILQLSSLVESSFHKAVNEGSLNNKGTMPQADFKRMGRYAYFLKGKDVGCWFGIHFQLWKTYGRTPLWLVFTKYDWCRAREVWSIVEPKAEKEGKFTKFVDNGFIVAIDLESGKERDHVIRNIADQLKWIAEILRDLPPKEK